MCGTRLPQGRGGDRAINVLRIMIVATHGRLSRAALPGITCAGMVRSGDKPVAKKSFVDHNAAFRPDAAGELVSLLAQYDIEAPLLHTQSAATKLFDGVDGWQKIDFDDIATIHLICARRARCTELAVSEPAVSVTKQDGCASAGVMHAGVPRESI
jgi:hypothetical protein